MIKFINNIGEYFASNYFDEDFAKKVIEKSGYSRDALKEFQQQITQLKPDYFKLKQQFVENHLRVKDRVNLSHNFHTKVLKALGYDADKTNYDNLYPINGNSVLPVRQILYRGDKVHMMIMEMHALIKTGDEEPDGLFEQSYNVDPNEEPRYQGEQKYHRKHWEDVFKVPEELTISPMIINEAISKLFLLAEHRRPKYILLCAGNQYFLLESEKWFRGSYLQIDLEVLFDEASIDKDYLSLFYLLLSKDLLSPMADIVLMEQLDEDSHKAAYEVTKDLKEGVIHAVESIANEAVYYLNKQGVSYSEIDASKLKDDCLNMVYRLLFLFYAESREELDILPNRDAVYDKGYSLEMLRDLEQVPLQTESSLNGFFFHESLYKLFELLNEGYDEKSTDSKSFKIRQLDSPLFSPNSLHYLSDVKIRNRVWQDVIIELSLSKKQRNKNRGRISYANLGINQLGSVYESLLAFRGILAETDYIEVHKNRTGNKTSEEMIRSEGSFLVPRHRLDDFEHGEVYYEVLADDSEELRIIPEGTFIYRLSGRDRESSASYYTPEVLTQTTVKYTLKPILEKLDKGEMQALDLLDLKILEPAMGAAAFHNEAINQIAKAYLDYRTKELNTHVDPNKYKDELQKIKAYIALNNVYGVDINPTAIELGKLSLWLNVIHKEMQTPFFGYRLGVGNAVIGSWLKVYNHRDFSFEPQGRGHKTKKWWEKAPKHLIFGDKGINRRNDEIYHFLLPDQNMASSASIRLLKDKYPVEAKRVTEWKKEFTKPLRGDEYKLLQKLSIAIDKLLLEHYEMQKNISLITEINTDFFGNPNQEQKLDFAGFSYDQKQQFAENRFKSNAPYYKLKLIMDYWCALWFWDVRDAAELPTRSEWYQDLTKIINIDLIEYEQDEANLVSENTSTIVRDYRKDKREREREITEKLKGNPSSLFVDKRADLVKQYSEQYKFFHYELEFIEVYREKNGFDVVVGNPPWVEITFDEGGVVSEFYPEVLVKKFTSPKIKKLTTELFKVNKELKYIYIEELINSEILKQFIGSYQNYSLLNGHRSNLYKCILENGLHWISEKGYMGLLHPEGIYDDPNGYALRKEVYPRLKYHFQFVNELVLFAEVDHHTKYSINVYTGNKKEINFYSISNLFHPSTIDGCFIHSGSGQLHGYKVMNENTEKMEWNLLPHLHRIVEINEDVLKILARTFEDSDDWEGAKLVTIHAQEIIEIIEKIGKFNSTIKNYQTKITDGWNEVNAVNDSIIERKTIYPNIEVYEMIYSGPHVFVGNPMYKTPREMCTLNSHYDIINFSKIDESYVARTNYVPLNVNAGYGSTIKGFELKDGNFDNWLDYYKVAFRKMIGSASERTLSGAIIPPKTAHINGLISIIFRDQRILIEFNALTDSLVYDFYLKTIGKSNLYDETLSKLPLGVDKKYHNSLFVRTLQLNCLNKYYAPLWEDNYSKNFNSERWSIEDKKLKPFETLTPNWSWDIPLRNYFERRQALVEIDVITAMALDISLDELILMYDIQFPVLQQNEDDTWYDAKGNIVFTCSKGLVGVGLDRPDWELAKDMKEGERYEYTITKSELYYGDKVTYYAPFTKQDRVEDYRKAWAFFEKKFKE
ncbi:MAG: type II restriction endonuclease subunit M [Fermentimonas sp.]|nr:type II restriction endonuclease subunit M [Fermentimonas sp.]